MSKLDDMGGDEDKPCGSNSMSTTPGRSIQSGRGRRSKQKDSSKELNDVEKKELLRKFAETDQNLEKFAQAHNMTALNVKSVLRSVIKNHRALARVLGTDAPDDSIDGVRITRSKTRALQDSSNLGVDMTSNVPIKRGNNWIDFRFNDDDEYDNDYRPGDGDSEEEVGSDSTQVGSSEDESDHLSDFDKDGEQEDEEDDHQGLTIADDFVDESLGEIGFGPSDLPPRPRPDSAASLTLNAMMGEDDEPSIDYKLFVNNLNLDEIPYDEDDNEEDPEYMVPTDAIFRDDRDDFMGDYWSSTIPQKEMEDLIEDIVPGERLVELAKNLSPPLRKLETSKTEVPIPIPTEVAVERENEEWKGGNVFNDFHRSQLRTQLEQHVQLLTQTFVGCYFEPLLQDEKEKARGMIEGLVGIASNTWHLGAKSAFHISNLSYAVETCNGMVDEKLDKPLRPLALEHLTIPHSMLSVTKNVLGSSRAIVYPDIVSRFRLVQSIGSSGWSQSEIILFAMALNRYGEKAVKHTLPKQSKYSIIAENCLPWRTMNELRWQYNGMNRGLKRNGRSRHNQEFFDVIEGKKKLHFEKPIRAKIGWTMSKWQKSCLPPWFNFQRMERRSMELKEREKGSESEKTRKERRIEEGDEENEPIVILDDEEEGEDEGMELEMDHSVPIMEIEEKEEEKGKLINENEDRRKREILNMMTFSMDDDECAMDSMGKSVMGRSPGEVEEMRGEENEGEGQPIDFSHLMNEMSPSGTSRVRSPPSKDRSITPHEKTIFPPTPGKRIPSPSEESMPWMDLIGLRTGFDSPLCYSPLTSSRIKTPGGTMDYVDSLMGYFGSPERETETKKGMQSTSPSKRANAYCNLFGDFDFDESDGENEMANMTVKEELVERQESDAPVIVRKQNRRSTKSISSSDEVPAKQKQKRRTREEKEKIGLAAIKDASLRGRMLSALARKTAEDIRARMTMHSSVFKQIQNILSQTIDKGDRETMIGNMLPVLSSHHKEVLYLLSVFVPPSSLPRTLVLAPGREAYVTAIHMMCTIYAYMSKIQRRISYRQLLKTIVDAHSKGGTENVLSTLEGVLMKDPLLFRVLSDYYAPPVPSKKSRVWESVDLRKGDEAFNIFKEDASTERVDLCCVMGGAMTKRALLKAGKTLSALRLNNDGEPLLRNKDGKYKGIAVWSQHQMEEERKNRAIEKEEEKKAKQREKTKERIKAVKKAKMVEKREERAREKKKEKERMQEEEERKKEEKEAPPIHPFTRDMDRALLHLYNDVQKVTKRAVRKMAVEIPYSSNFSLEQLQSRLDFLLAVAKED